MSDRPPVLDQQVIAELLISVGGDDAFVADLVRTYLAEGSEHIGQIVAASEAGDLASMVRPAHSLKSSSAALGATRLSQISREIELAGREGRTEGLAAQVVAAREAWAEAVEALRTAGLVD